ncbi:hypothetical protein ACVWZM_001837 [Bradyrhizobium sp. USDA 4501]
MRLLISFAGERGNYLGLGIIGLPLRVVERIVCSQIAKSRDVVDDVDGQRTFDKYASDTPTRPPLFPSINEWVGSNERGHPTGRPPLFLLGVRSNSSEE